MDNLKLSKEEINNAWRKFGNSMFHPSVCSHMDIDNGNIIECRKCGRKIIEALDGFKFFYLANGVHYLTHKPKKYSSYKEGESK